MVSRRTRIFGLIHIFLYSSMLHLIILLSIVIVLVMVSQGFYEGLSKLNGEASALGTLFFVMITVILIAAIILVTFLLPYVILNIRNYRKKINKNIIPYRFFCINLMFSILLTLVLYKPLFADLLIVIKERDGFFLPIGSLIIFFPISGILYSVFGIIDYKKNQNRIRGDNFGK